MSDYSRINTVRQIKPHTVMKRSARVSLRSMPGDALRNVRCVIYESLYCAGCRHCIQWWGDHLPRTICCGKGPPAL